MSRIVLSLNKNADTTIPSQIGEYQLYQLLQGVAKRKQDGTMDEEDVRIVKARRDYLNDDQLQTLIGMTYDEIEAEVRGDEAPAKKGKKASKDDDTE